MPAHQKRGSDLIIHGCETQCGCWILNSGLLWEQPVFLTTKPFPQHHFAILFSSSTFFHVTVPHFQFNSTFPLLNLVALSTHPSLSHTHRNTLSWFNFCSLCVSGFMADLFIIISQLRASYHTRLSPPFSGVIWYL